MFAPHRSHVTASDNRRSLRMDVAWGCARVEPESRIATIWARRRIVALVTTAITLFSLYAFLVQTRSDAQWDHGSGAVGALFVRALGLTVAAPFCTASIVPSPRGDLLITAAHCLGKVPVTDITFAPFYHAGISPFGDWKVTGQVFAPRWYPGGDPNSDFAFLTVNGDVQARAGAEQIGLSLPFPASVTVEGYSVAGGLKVCTGKPTTIEVEHQQQLKFSCSGFLNGSSGGPFLTGVSKKSGLGTIVGVVGGYQQGGNSPDVSYSSPLSSAVMSLYEKIIRKMA
jgi:hypothetical protein